MEEKDISIANNTVIKLNQTINEYLNLLNKKGMSSTFQKDMRLKLNLAKCFGRNLDVPLSLNYIIKNKNFCMLYPNLLVLHILQSELSDFDTRMTIRNLWGAARWTNLYDYKILFMLPYSKNASLNSYINEEFRKYGDIIQFEYRFSKLKNTLVDLTIFDWVHKYCSNIKWILLTRHLIFLNIFEFVR